MSSQLLLSAEKGQFEICPPEVGEINKIAKSMVANSIWDSYMSPGSSWPAKSKGQLTILFFLYFFGEAVLKSGFIDGFLMDSAHFLNWENDEDERYTPGLKF